LKKKTLQELNLLSRFLFAQTMDCPEAQEAALQIILNDVNLRLLTGPQTEKELRTAPWLRSIRLDVFSLDENKTIYDTEMQGEYRNDLVKRSRYYQALIDSSLLEPGNVNFNLLNNTCFILITPFDLFGLGKYCYTFLPCCNEDTALRLGDGTVRIFLNTRGTDDSGASRELIDFLHYIERTDDEFAEQTKSEKIRKIHGCVKKIKSSEEMGVKYMQSWEEKIIDRQKGREEGRLEDRAQIVLEFLQEFGTVSDVLQERITNEKDFSLLSSWVKLAARAENIEDFCVKAGINSN